MLKDYRDWLESELKLLGNASHHAYSFGQANMAKRALERLDAEFGGKVVFAVDREQAAAAVSALDELAKSGTLDPGLQALREHLASV